MKFQIISDIHLEYYDVLPNIDEFFTVEAPNLILAGDICYYKHPNFMLFFDKISKLYEHIFFVPGNHDYYSYYDIPDINFEQIDFIMEENLKIFKNVHFIQNSIFEIDNNIILGTTLWCRTQRTDTDIGIKIIPSEFYIITESDKYSPTYRHLKLLNTKQYNWLKDTLKGIHLTQKNIIVVTHYLPSKKCIHNKYKNSPCNDLYFTDCEELLPFCNCWVAGHTHDPFIGKINGCDVFVNPRGDPDEITPYDKKLVVETYTPQAHL